MLYLKYGQTHEAIRHTSTVLVQQQPIHEKAPSPHLSSEGVNLFLQ